jgi:hypothetical protein
MAKRVLDEETRKQLLGYVPFSSDAKITFTPDEFKSIKDETLRPVFIIRSLSQAELTQLKKNSQGYSKESTPEDLTRMAEGNMSVIRDCIVGWENLFDSGNGEEVEFVATAKGGCDENLFKRLPMWLVRSLMTFIRKISGLTDFEDLSLK